MSIVTRIRIFFTRRYSPNTAYQIGDTVKVSIPGTTGNNIYLLEATAVTTGNFRIEDWNNLTPKIHVINNENQLRGYALNGDTVKYGGSTVSITGYTAIAQLFERETPELSFVESVIPVLSATKKFVANFYDYYVSPVTAPERYYGMPTAKSGIEGMFTIQKIDAGVTAKVKCVIKQPVTPYFTTGTEGFTSHRFGLIKNTYSWGVISTPDFGNTGTDNIRYNLPNNVNDFQWFSITNNGGVIDVVQHPVNTEI